jgi:MurNAc alpha-1-phosphate uridylyltransferase
MTLHCPAPLRAIVLAAGRGERMRPLTDHTPKPLLPILGRPMIEWHLLALARDGVREVLINTAWLEEQFPALLGDGCRFGLSIRYAHEGRDFGGALETAGGIKTALPWLTEGDREAFWVVSGDIWAPDFHFDASAAEHFLQSGQQAHLWLVPNPVYHPKGDFDIATPDGALERLTYANLALMRPALLDSVAAGQRSALGPLLHQGLQNAQIELERYTGRWENIGTPAQWAALQTPAA